MALGVYELILFKHGILIDSTEVYILILVCVTLTVIQGYNFVKKGKLLSQLSHKFLSWSG